MSGDHNMKGQCPSCGGDCGRTAKSGCNYGREPAHTDHPMRHHDRTCQGAEPVAYLWQHCETGRTRIVMPDDVITADATWFVVGPLYLHPAPKQESDFDLRGRWLTEKLCERTTPDGRTVLEIVDEPIWAKADGTFADYCAAVDAAMAADEDWWASERA